MRTATAFFILAFTALLTDFGVRAKSNPHIVYKYTDAYELIWNDGGTGGDHDLSVWRVKNYQSDFCSLGDVANDGYKAPTTKAVLVREYVPGALAKPRGFSRVWTDAGSGGGSGNAAFYTMIAPSGYTCLGSVVTASDPNLPTPSPDSNNYCCVKNEYLVQAESEFIWNDRGTGAHADVSLWTVIRSGGDAYGINGGNFIAVSSYTQPSRAYLLKEDSNKVHDLWSHPSDKSNKPLSVHEVSDLQQIWTDKGMGEDVKDVSIWRTMARKGYHSMGDIVVPSYIKPKIGFLLRPTDAKDYDSFKPPIAFHKIWTDKGSGAEKDVALWKVLCRPGYVSLGGVATDGSYPKSKDVSCIKKSHTVYGSKNNWNLLWQDRESGSDKDVSIYEAKATSANQQSVRGFGAVTSYFSKPRAPFLLSKKARNYWAEKPVEKMFMKNVQYDLDSEKRATSPAKMSPTVVENFSSETQSVQRSIEYSVTSSYTFTFNQEIQVGIAIEMSGGLPLVGEASTTVSLTSTTSFGFEETKEKTTTDSISATITLPGKSRITATIIGNEYKVDIPFTATVNKVYYDGTESVATVSGVYKGVAVKGMKVTYGATQSLA